MSDTSHTSPGASPPTAAEIDALSAYIEARIDDLRGACTRLDIPLFGTEERLARVRALTEQAHEALRRTGYPLLQWNLLVDEASLWSHRPDYQRRWSHRRLCESGLRAVGALREGEEATEGRQAPRVLGDARRAPHCGLRGPRALAAASRREGAAAPGAGR